MGQISVTISNAAGSVLSDIQQSTRTWFDSTRAWNKLISACAEISNLPWLEASGRVRWVSETVLSQKTLLLPEV